MTIDCMVWKVPGVGTILVPVNLENQTDLAENWRREVAKMVNGKRVKSREVVKVTVERDPEIIEA